MKTKLLGVVFALAMLFTGGMVMSACGGGGYTKWHLTLDNQNIVDVSLDEYTAYFDGNFKEGESKTYYLRLQDYYDRTKLDVRLNGEKIELNALNHQYDFGKAELELTTDESYDQRFLGYEYEVVATLTVSDLKEEVTMTSTCEEQEITLKFFEQDFNAPDAIPMLQDFYFEREGQEDVTLYDAMQAGSAFELKTNFSSLEEDDTIGPIIKCNKKVGYYKDDFLNGFDLKYLESDTTTKSYHIKASYDQPLQAINNIEIKKSIIDIADFHIGIGTSGSILQTTQTGEVKYNEKTAFDVKVLRKDGVDFSNAILYCNGDVIAEGDELAGVDGTYFTKTFGVDDYPVDFGDWNFYKGFQFDLQGVEVDTTSGNVKTVDIECSVSGKIEEVIDNNSPYIVLNETKYYLLGTNLEFYARITSLDGLTSISITGLSEQIQPILIADILASTDDRYSIQNGSGDEIGSITYYEDEVGKSFCIGIYGLADNALISIN